MPSVLMTLGVAAIIIVIAVVIILIIWFTGVNCKSGTESLDVRSMARPVTSQYSSASNLRNRVWN